MKSTTRRVVLLVVIQATSVFGAQNRPNSLEQEAKRQVGNVATLCGKVVMYQCERPERTTLLALEKPFPEAGGVSVAIARENRAKFGARLEQQHVLMDVCATGPVEKLKRRYIIRVEDPTQLQLQGVVTPTIPFGANSVSKCDDDVELPKLIKEVKPEYTRAALIARISGAVLLEAVVLTDGSVGDIRLLRSLDSQLGLDDQAVKALESWRFSPGTLSGRPTPVVVTVELSFQLK